MDIYVVQDGDTINSIADKFNISVERLIIDNGLINPYLLVIGQALVILYPQKTYVVQPGDNLATIADSNGTSILQLHRNNPFLYDRDYIFSGESIVISYSTIRDLEVNGFVYTFINHDTLKRTLPYLTYLSVFNYRIVENGSIINYGDDTEIIEIAKDYQAIPLLMISAFSPTGELDLEVVYNLLLNEEKQDNLINEMLQIVRSKKISGINLLISNLNETNQNLYFNVLSKLSKALRNEGYILVITINPDSNTISDTAHFENIDYSTLSSIADRIIFLKSNWGSINEPPSPVSNISLIRPLIDFITTKIPPEIILIGKPLIGYDWELPYVPGVSKVNSISLISAITLAYDQGAVIQFDEESQTPYFYYVRSRVGAPESHIVWFIDARSIKALNDVIIEYDLVGSGIWNISSYYQQMWSIVNATFNIVKLPIL